MSADRFTFKVINRQAFYRFIAIGHPSLLTLDHEKATEILNESEGRVAWPGVEIETEEEGGTQ